MARTPSVRKFAIAHGTKKQPSDPQSGDHVVVEKGATVFVDPEVVAPLCGAEVDFREEQFFTGFVFNNPNEKGRCGCGESFYV